jgi:putative transcriptional regulator
LDTTLKGRLLVATPLLDDPNFHHAVIWLLEHGEDGALGVVLNRPSELPVAEPLPGWADLTGGLPVLFVGGPVAVGSVIGLARMAETAPEGVWEPVTGSVGVLDLGADPGIVGPSVGTLRCFAGYAGWSPGQLEDELAEGAWFVVDADPADPFTDDPDRLWRSVLARQPNELARIALVPDDPTLN